MKNFSYVLGLILSLLASSVQAYDPILPISKGGTGTSSNKYLFANPVSGASAEYPMDEGTGTSVRDISGKGNNAIFGTSTNAPSWTQYGIAFNQNVASASVLPQYVSTPLTQFYTAILNVCPQTYSALSTSLIPAPSLMSFVAYNNGATSGSILTSTLNFSDGSGGHQSFTPGTIYNGALNTRTQTGTSGCVTIAWVLDTLDHIYVNGVEQAYLSQGNAASRVVSNVNYLLGGYYTGNANSLVGTINYAVFYPTVLSQSQVQQVSAYVEKIVSRRTNWPNNLKRSSASNSQFICDGDSLTAGLGGSGTWCNSTYITPVTNTYTYTAWAWAGEYALDKIGTANMRWLTSISPNAGRNICEHWTGTNDMLHQTAAVAWSSLQRLAAFDKSNNCISVLSTVISRNGFDTNKNQLNALIRAGWQQAGFIMINDLGAIPELGSDGAYANPGGTCFFSDGTHLVGPGAGTCRSSLTGYGVVGAQMAKVINILDGATLDNPITTTSNAYVQNTGDNVVVQDPTLAATNQLIDCTGLTGIKRTIVNADAALNVTATTSASQTITGSAIVLPSTTGVFTCELISAAAGGNYWLRTQ